MWALEEVQADAEAFVPATDEVWHLQNRPGLECEFFRSFAEHGHYGGRVSPTDTRQGIYFVAPSGRFLASLNSNDPKQVRAAMARALAAWHELAESERYLDPPPADAEFGSERGEMRRPSAGLVLQVVSRDLVAPRNWPGQTLNLDFLWYGASAARSWLPQEVKVGAAAFVPRATIERMARFHMVDNVRGQSPGHEAADVREAEVEARIVAIEDSRIVVRWTGHVRIEVAGKPLADPDAGTGVGHERGLDLAFGGYGTFDLESQSFREFQAVAIGTRWGGSRYNFRRDDLLPQPIGFAFLLAGDEPADRVAPAAWHAYSRD